MNVEKLRELFIHVTDKYATQLPDGSYQCNRFPLKDQALEEHLSGKRTLGTYQISKEDTAKWACFDIDVNKTVWDDSNFDYSRDWEPKVMEQVKIIKNLLSSKGITGYTEFSGFKGAHVWIFFDQPILAKTVKDVLEFMTKDMVVIDPENMHVEIFPKQSSILTNGDSTGSLVKIPCGRHRRSEEFSYFIDDVLTDVKYATQAMLEKIVSPIDAIFNNCVAMETLRNEAPKGYLNHNQRLALAFILLNVENGEEELRRLIEMQNDYDINTTNMHINQIVAKRYKPITCAKLQEQGICPGPCANIKNGNSPIAFYHRHRGRLGMHEQEAEFKFKDPLEDYKRVGNEYFSKEPFKGWTKLSNFVVEFDTQITRDDGEQVITTLEGRVIKGEDIMPIKIDAQDMSHVDRFKSVIYNVLGNQGLFCTNFSKLQIAVNKYTDSRKISIKEYFGYLKDEKDLPTKYISPSTLIDKTGVYENTSMQVDLSKKDLASSLDIMNGNDHIFPEVVKSVKEDLLNITKTPLVLATLAHTFLPIIHPWLAVRDGKKFVLFLKGASGEGKSFLAESVQHFYGPKFTKFATWTSTPLSLVVTGSNFKDALLLIDDWKMDNLKIGRGGLQAARTVLQNYADGNTRSRLKTDASPLATKPINSIVLMTGEDFIEGQSSVVARVITLDYEQPIKDIERGNRIKEMREYYSLITGNYIHHVFNIPDQVNTFDTYLQTKLLEFYEITKGQHNDIRTARNFAQLMTSFHFFSKFFWDHTEAADLEQTLYDYLVNIIPTQLRLSAQQRPSQRFWTALTEMIASGKLRFQTSSNIDEGKTWKGVTVGFKGGSGDTFIMLNLAISEVEKYLASTGEGLSFSTSTVIEELIKDGRIVSPEPIRKFMNNQIANFHQIDLTKD